MLSDNSVIKISDQYLDLKTEQWNISTEFVKVFEPYDIATTFLSYEEIHHYPAVYLYLMD